MLYQICLSKSWINKTMRKAGLRARKAGTDKQHEPANAEQLIRDIMSFIIFVIMFYFLKFYFDFILKMLYRLARIIAQYNVPPSLVINGDQTGIYFYFYMYVPITNIIIRLTYFCYWKKDQSKRGRKRVCFTLQYFKLQLKKLFLVLVFLVIMTNVQFLVCLL